MSAQDKQEGGGAAATHGAKTAKAYVMIAVWFQERRGLERYREYLEAASPIAEKYGARRVEALIPVETLQGSFEPDYIFVVEWPDLDSYFRFLKDVQYRAVAPMLGEAVRKISVLHCRRH